MSIVQLDYRRQVPPITGFHMIRRSPIAGIIRSILVHFPRGCWSLVTMRVGIEARGIGQIFPSPSEDWMALDNATKEFAMNQDIQRGEPIWVDIRNADVAFPHTPSCIIEIVGDE